MLHLERADDTPIYSTCYPGDELRAYNREVDEYANLSASIEINERALNITGARPVEPQWVLDHELGHAQGPGP